MLTVCPTTSNYLAHTAKVMFSEFLSFGSQGGGVSGKVHYEHILATKVLMHMGVGGLGVQESALFK